MYQLLDRTTKTYAGCISSPCMKDLSSLGNVVIYGRVQPIPCSRGINPYMTLLQ